MQKNIYIGIDPGYSKSIGRGGAVAVLDTNGLPIYTFLVDTVSYRLGKTGKERLKPDTEKLSDRIFEIIERHNPIETLGVIEHPPMPREQFTIIGGKEKKPAPVTTMFSVFMAFGGLWTVLDGLCHEVFPVLPVSWRSAFKLASGKYESLQKARELFPGVDLRKQSDHNIAEALLIAEYGRLRVQESRQRVGT